ncbi:MAG: hypothetical protein LBR53_06335 [Deltaproteobacteria bacterium]|jgi:hypothetical protein|nr:hypothetical protein [Deltaproteobacteria bacterium]
MSVTHTYIFEPGLWSVEGIYRDGKNIPHAQEGQLLVSHTPELWTIDSQLKISGRDKRDFLTRYEFAPFSALDVYAEWKSFSGGPEPIYGLFVVIEESVMTPWQSQTGQYWGQEVLTFQSSVKYLSRGFAFLKDKLVSSWSAELQRLTD